jgi:CheY-like chemotaxis protein
MHRIAVLDDDLDSRTLLSVWLEGTYQVTQFGRAADVLRWLNTGAACDLILSDISMPEMDGLEFVRRLRYERRLDVPVIAVSAHANAVASRTALATGFDAYLTKPIDLEHLLETIEGYLKQ